MKSSTFRLGPKKTPINNVGLVVIVGGGWGEGVGGGGGKGQNLWRKM